MNTQISKIESASMKAFSLIELMIVVAIVGILAAVAIPAYSDYSVRAKMTELIAYGSAAKTSVSEYYMSEGKFPETADAADAGIVVGDNANFTKLVKGLTYTKIGDTEVRIIILGDPTDLGEVGESPNIRLEGIVDTTSGAINWSCGPDLGGDLDKKLLPASCRSDFIADEEE